VTYNRPNCLRVDNKGCFARMVAVVRADFGMPRFGFRDGQNSFNLFTGLIKVLCLFFNPIFICNL
jgi:hypothetical protein